MVKSPKIRGSLKEILMRNFDRVVVFCHYIMSKTGYHNN